MTVNKAHIAELYEAIAALRTPEECQMFFEDVCTLKEVADMSQRLAAARLLKKNKSYKDVCSEIGISSATLCRVNKCLNYGSGGYALVLERREKENT